MLKTKTTAKNAYIASFTIFFLDFVLHTRKVYWYTHDLCFEQLYSVKQVKQNCMGKFSSNKNLLPAFPCGLII